MKLPRDVSGAELANALGVLGYCIVRQTGSHLRLKTMLDGEHYITIPKHSPLRIGTLSAILSEVASHFKISRDDVVERVLLR